MYCFDNDFNPVVYDLSEVASIPLFMAKTKKKELILGVKLFCYKSEVSCIKLSPSHLFLISTQAQLLRGCPGGLSIKTDEATKRRRHLGYEYPEFVRTT